MKKNIFIIALAFVPVWMLAQNATTSQSTYRLSDEDFYDEYEYGDDTFYRADTTNNSTDNFSSSSFVLDDSDATYSTGTDDTYSAGTDDNTYSTGTDDTYSIGTDDNTVAGPYTVTSDGIDETIEVKGNKDTYTYKQPVRHSEVVQESELEPEQESEPEAELQDSIAEEGSDSALWDGTGHHIQFGFGGAWSGFATRISEDLGTSRINAPAFTGSFNYFYFPFKILGFGTGLHLSHYRGNLLMAPDAVIEKYATGYYTDANGVYARISDSDGDNYKHHIGVGGFNEIVNIHMLEVPIALQLKYKFGGVAGLYANLGFKLGLPVASVYKVKTGVVEHYGEYTQYGLTLHNVPGEFGYLDYTGRGGSYALGRQILPVNFLGYAELGVVFRVHPKIDLMLGAYFDMVVHDVSMARADNRKTPIGFNAAPYNYPWMNQYKGLVGTDMLGEIRPYNVGVKASISFYVAPKKQNKDKDDDDQNDSIKKPVRRHGNDTIRDTLIIIHDTIVYHRYTNHYEYDTLGYDSTKMKSIRDYMDPNSDNPYLNGSKTRSTGVNSYDPADGDDYVYNKDALDKGRKYSDDLRNRQEMLNGDEQAIVDYLGGLSIRFQLDKAYPPFVVPRQGLNLVAKTLKANPDMVIAVNGHACRLGTERYNRRLALRRARNIAKLLKMRGVDESQMLVASYGSHVPSAYGAHSLSKDRRVELVLLGSMTYEQREAYLNKFAEQIGIQDMIHEGQRDNSYDLYDTFSGEMRVKQGTSLAKLAAAYYGDRDYWVYLYEANSDIISNPRIIEPGTSLMVPELDKIMKGRSKKTVKQEALQLREYYLRQIGYSGREDL